MTSIKLPPEDAERDRLEELAQKRAEHCWPKDMVRQFETRCDFREGWHAYAEHHARQVRSVKDASAEELMENPLVKELLYTIHQSGLLLANVPVAFITKASVLERILKTRAEFNKGEKS